MLTFDGSTQCKDATLRISASSRAEHRPAQPRTFMDADSFWPLIIPLTIFYPSTIVAFEL